MVRFDCILLHSELNVRMLMLTHTVQRQDLGTILIDGVLTTCQRRKLPKLPEHRMNRYVFMIVLRTPIEQY